MVMIKILAIGVFIFGAARAVNTGKLASLHAQRLLG